MRVKILLIISKKEQKAISLKSDLQDDKGVYRREIRFQGHTAYIAEVKRDLGLPMYDATNVVEELKQPRKHPIAENVEVIKDALKHFGVI